MDRENQFERIERYLADEQTAAEKAAFERELAEDAQLRAELDLHRWAAESLADGGLLDLAERLQQIDAQWQAPPTASPTAQPKLHSRPPARRTYQGPLLALAASVVLLIGLFRWTNQGFTDETTPVLAQYFEPYPMVLNQRSALDTLVQTPLTNRAIQTYLAGDYATAEGFFAELSALEAQPLYDFYRGVCLLATGRAEAAQSYLQKVLNTEEPLLVQQARWYLALAHLAAGELDRGKGLLEAIAEGDYRWEGAQELLNN